MVVIFLTIPLRDDLLPDHTETVKIELLITHEISVKLFVIVIFITFLPFPFFSIYNKKDECLFLVNVLPLPPPLKNSPEMKISQEKSLCLPTV